MGRRPPRPSRSGTLFPSTTLFRSRFVLEVVSEADPWFEQGASADVFAARFRNFVVARCRGQGLKLSANEFDLIDAWFGTVQSQGRRSEEHTSELQSLMRISYAVFCLKTKNQSNQDQAPNAST